jgi:hypothetical protein
MITSTLPDTRAQLLAAAKALTLLTAAVVKASSAIGVLWCSADHLLKADRFVASTETMVRGNHAATGIWVRTLARDGAPDATGRSTLIVASHGLAAFAGRELEFAPTAKYELGHLAMRVMQIGTYLIDSGAKLDDGHTVGPENFIVALTNGQFHDDVVLLRDKNEEA